MKIELDIPVGRVRRKLKEHGLDQLGLSDEEAGRLLAESAFFVPAEDPAGRLLGVLARASTEEGE